MKLSEKLWCDLKTDIEKHNWLLLGRGYETGVVAHVIQTDLANTYNKIINLTQERDTYRDLCSVLVQALDEISGLTDSPKACKIALPAITKAEAILGEKNGRVISIAGK